MNHQTFSMNFIPSEEDIPFEESPNLGGQPSLFELLFTVTPRAPSGVARTEESPPLEVIEGDNVGASSNQPDVADTVETTTVFSLFGSLFSSTNSSDEFPRSGRVLSTSAPDFEPPTTERGWSSDERSWSDVFLTNLQARRANRRLQRGGFSQLTNMNTALKPVNLRPHRGRVNFKKIKVPANGKWRLRHWG